MICVICWENWTPNPPEGWPPSDSRPPTLPPGVSTPHSIAVKKSGARIEPDARLSADTRRSRSVRGREVRVRESNHAREPALRAEPRSDSISPGTSRSSRPFVAGKSGCENRTRVSASTRLKDNHYPNPDTRWGNIVVPRHNLVRVDLKYVTTPGGRCAPLSHPVGGLMGLRARHDRTWTDPGVTVTS
jgi:hypothetical protein